MRAVLVDSNKQGAEKLYIGDVPTPTPGDDEVLVKIKAFGLNRMDISQREGKYPPPPGASDILGVEFSGVVDEVGQNVTKWSKGQEVLGLSTGGAYAEYIVIESESLLPKPASMTWVVAAGIMENYVTAFQALVTIANVKQNENVLIHTGASGVGTAALQLAKSAAVKTIFTTASSDEKLAFLHKLIGGTDLLHTINYKQEDFQQKIKDITEGKGVDVVIDFVGQSHWNQNLASLALDGRMVVLALMSGSEVEKASLGPILSKRLQITGSSLRSRSPQYRTALIQRFGQEVLPRISDRSLDSSPNAVTDGKDIQVVVYAVYPMSEIIKAHQMLEGNASIGKIVIEV